MNMMLRPRKVTTLVPKLSPQPLHNALASGDRSFLHVLAFKYQLDSQAMISATKILREHLDLGFHISVLQSAVMTGNYKLCSLLIWEGAAFSSSEEKVSPPLILALEKKYFDIALLLITSGANVCVQYQSHTPLSYAIKNVCPEHIVEAIISAGFPLDGVIEVECGSTALHRAVSCENIPVVEYLLKYGADGNRQDSKMEFTPMHLAVKKRLQRVVKMLAEYGVDLEIECIEGFTPLICAINVDHTEILKTLLEFGADPNHISSVKLLYPLSAAAYLCRQNIVQLLLEHGSDVKRPSPRSGNLAIHSAVYSKIGKDSLDKLVAIVEALIKNGSPVDIPNKYGETPLQLAVKERNWRVVEVLVREGANVNKKVGGGTLFHGISQFAPNELVSKFLEYGADYSIKNTDGFTPYHLSLLNSEGVLSVFWRYGCSFDSLLGNKFENAAYTAENLSVLENQWKLFTGMMENDEKVVKDAIANGAEVKGCCKDLPYPLHFAVSKCSFNIILLLLENGVSPNSFDNEGETPLHKAARLGRFQTCLHLLRYGACYNCPTKSPSKSSSSSKTDGKTPLQIAEEKGNNKVGTLLKTLVALFKCRKSAVNEVEKLKKILDFHSKRANVPLAFLNSINRKGNTLMATALNRKAKTIADMIIRFRIRTTYDF